LVSAVTAVVAEVSCFSKSCPIWSVPSLSSWYFSAALQPGNHLNVIPAPVHVAMNLVGWHVGLSTLFRLVMPHTVLVGSSLSAFAEDCMRRHSVIFSISTP
jgi:hypothetical protein